MIIWVMRDKVPRYTCPRPPRRRKGLKWQSFAPPAARQSRRYRGLISHRRSHGTLVSEEDQWIVPLIQQNLDAGVYDRGPLSPRHESGVFHFHKTARGPRLRTSRRQSRSIRVTWDDGIAGTFHHLWLRDNRVSNLRHEYLRLPTRDSANIAAESTTVRVEVRPRSRNPLQCCRPFLIVAGVTGWRMKH